MSYTPQKKYGYTKVSSGGARNWIPTDTTTLAWLDFRSNITDAGGGAVSAWNDKSGNNRHVIQPTGSNRPTLGVSGVSFDGVNDRLESSSPFMYNQANGVHIFVVMTAPATGTNRKFITEGNNSSTSPEYSMLSRDNTTTEQTLLSQFIRDDMNIVQIAYGVNTGTTAAFDNTFKLLEHIDTGTQILTSINAVAESSPFSYTRSMVPLTLNLFTIGCLIKTTAQQFMLCIVKEIAIIPANASADVKTRMQGYLAWNNALEGSLPAGHIYKNARPTI